MDETDLENSKRKVMVHCKVEDLYGRQYIYLWVILSFKAGLINAIGFLVAGKFVSHITGFGTQIGISFAQNKYIYGLELLLVPICFILGSSLVTFVLERQFDSKTIPNYPLIQALITFLIGFTAFMALFGFFDHSHYFDTTTLQIIFLSLLCLICGLKNGLTTWATHGKIRTTHITGLATDIGLHLPKFFFNKKNYRYPEKRRVNFTRIITLVSFSLGSFISAITYSHIGYYSLLIAFFISLILLIVSIVNRKNNIQKLKVLTTPKED